jgi:N-acetylmuramic acid 6-phosphate (MurNAc-6-P) etherase
MVNLMPVNAKLVRRAQRLISEVSGCTLDHAKQVFSESGKETKTAMIMAMLGVDALEARRLLTTWREHQPGARCMRCETFQWRGCMKHDIVFASMEENP